MLRIDLEKNSFSRTKKINKIMFVVVPIMNSEPFIKVGHRIRYPNFLIFQRAVNSIMNYYMNSTVVLRIQLHIVMYLGYTREYDFIKTGHVTTDCFPLQFSSFVDLIFFCYSSSYQVGAFYFYTKSCKNILKKNISHDLIMIIF